MRLHSIHAAPVDFYPEALRADIDAWNDVIYAGEIIELTAADGHRLSAWRARPSGEPRGGIVIIQEIFGMTGQMKRCTDRYAEHGYLAILPAMFDRVEPGLVLGYDEFQKGGQSAASIDDTVLALDLEAARNAVASAGRVAIVGFCWGGTVAYIGASLGIFDCAISYYGGGIGQLTNRMTPEVSVQYHFGARDQFITPETIERIRAADPAGDFHVYEGADHGFNCDDRGSYHAGASRLAEDRTLAFLAEHL